jgi:hypothetical protein
MAEPHTHLPESSGYVIAIIAGLVLLIIDWYGGVALLGWGWAIVIGIIGVALIIIGFLKLLFG